MQRIINRLAVIIIDNDSTLRSIFNKIIKSTTTPSDVIEEITSIHSYLTEQAPLFVTIRLDDSTTFIKNYTLCLEFHKKLMSMYNIYHDWLDWLETQNNATYVAEFEILSDRLMDRIGLLLSTFTSIAKRMLPPTSNSTSARRSGGRKNRRTTCAKKARKVRTTRSRK